MDHGYGDTFRLEVVAQQLAGHVPGGLAAVVAVHPSALPLGPEGHGSALRREQDELGAFREAVIRRPGYQLTATKSTWLMERTVPR